MARSTIDSQSSSDTDRRETDEIASKRMTPRQRRREIAAVLIRHGLKELVIFTGLDRAVAAGRAAVGLPHGGELRRGAA